MSQPVPPPIVGTRCNRPVDGVMVSYPCTLATNHWFENDNEPHYAVEVDRSVRAWRKWKETHPDNKHVHVWAANEDGKTAICYECGEIAQIATMPMGAHKFPVVEDSLVPPGTFRVESMNHPSVAEWAASRPWREKPVVFADKHDDGGLTGQPKPTGDESQVDDQSLVIEDMQARRDYGLRKYGQTHQPYNGRNTLQDLYEELLDAALYTRSLLRARQAMRDELVAAVRKALMDAADVTEGFTVNFDKMAEVAVDRIIDALTMQAATD
jgi:hypothetical protein